ncbi:NAD(P)H-dependent flavin oxidoreductase [Neorickettsia sp. 179522]|uniref:NAD(P)H-dependent flavin oxidoreductase n=1 Tax=Neorickettsia sp. 179522 TaxID=1714371 RepID=UPI0005FFECBB|nr:nitronate monooxygenase [Neorickettsia sp. 179522]
MDDMLYSWDACLSESKLSVVKKLAISGWPVWPIIEGGKGVAVSDGVSSGAFAAAGCVGTFSAVNAKLIDHNGEIVPLEYHSKTRRGRHDELMEYSIKSAISQARIAHECSKGEGRIHMNVLWEMGGVERVLDGVLSKVSGLIHGITCGAGMPYKLAEIASRYRLYYYPIISSVKAFRILWKRSYRKFSEFLGGVVYEDPWLAGGHNGLSNSDRPDDMQDPYPRVVELRSFMNENGLNQVPIVMAGGVWSLSEWKRFIDNDEVGVVAFQFGTRPLVTKESPIPAAWKQKLLQAKKGDVLLHKFSPTGFYSSALKNEFIQVLIDRSKRQIPYSESMEGEFALSFEYGPRKRQVFIKNSDESLVQGWLSSGYTEVVKTPDHSIVFLTPDEFASIRADQMNCMGCLSHCKFSNWKDHDDYTTGKLPDPRSFCIQKTLQNIVYGADPETELAFAGHNAYRFSIDPLYRNGYMPSVKELVEKILAGE